MNRLTALISTLVFVVFPAMIVTAQDSAIFLRAEMETLDGEDFIFPDDLRAKSLNIVLLPLGEDRDNGTWQGEALVEWYAVLEEQGILNDDVMAWHFSFMKVPFFVKGFIRGGMAEDYAGKIPLSQAGPAFIKDVPGFAAKAGIKLDGQPTIVLVSSDGKLLQLFKGEATEENVAYLSAAIANYLPNSEATAD